MDLAHSERDKQQRKYVWHRTPRSYLLASTRLLPFRFRLRLRMGGVDHKVYWHNKKREPTVSQMVDPGGKAERSNQFHHEVPLGSSVGHARAQILIRSYEQVIPVSRFRYHRSHGQPTIARRDEHAQTDVIIGVFPTNIPSWENFMGIHKARISSDSLEN